MKWPAIFVSPLFLFCVPNAEAQDVYGLQEYLGNEDSSKHVILHDTSAFQKLSPDLFVFKNEKSFKHRIFVIPSLNTNGYKKINQVYVSKNLIQVHGNIYYDYYYRSNIDTPYILKNYQQHTVRTYLDVTIKNDYPLRVNFSARINNSGFLKDMAGINFAFNNRQFIDNIKAKLLNWLEEKKSNSFVLPEIEKEIRRRQEELEALKLKINRPSRVQEIIEERERAWLSKNSHAPGKLNHADLPKSKIISDSISYKTDSFYHFADSLQNTFDSVAHLAKEQSSDYKKLYDSLNRELQTLQKKQQSLSGKLSAQEQADINKIKTAGSAAQVFEQISSVDIPDSLLPSGYKQLLALKSFGIGRTVIDYSELSAKNITINGFQGEYNPNNYYALAAGMIDYRYRDFIISNPRRQKQYLTIARYGKGKMDGNNIIFTYYSGKKQLYNYVTSTNDSTQFPNYHLMGFSIEGHYKINNSTLLTAEIAKSASPYYNRTAAGKNLVSSNLSFADHSNEAYSLKISSYIPRTNTKLAGSYKRIGANFQSFSLYNTSARQSLWSARIDQPFFKRQLNITASIRTNDFANPYIDNSYYSNTIFKSIQATLRVRKLPVISLGYFPSSQLVKLSDDHLIENLFYTMTGYLSHYYTYGGVKMNTFLSYTRFYNRQSDSGFIYFNTKNVMLNHTVFFSKFSLTASGAAAMNNEYSLYTGGGDLQLNVSSNFSLKGGVKYNYQTVFNSRQLGYNIGSTVKIRKLGELQMYVEKGYIPGINKQLLPNNTGRFSYFKVF